MVAARLGDADFAKRYGPWALIVGGSDGSGAEFSRQVAARGINCVIVARRIEVLDALAAEIRADHGVEVRTASIDLERQDAAEALARVGGDVDVGLVVFNAGAEPSGRKFLETSLDGWKAIMRRNVDTLTAGLHHFAGLFAGKRRGGIVIVGSHAAFAGNARSGVYSATKGYALNLGESLWAELKPFGVDVLNLLIGTTDTPTLRRVLELNNIDADAVGAEPPNELVRAALDGIGDGPTLICGAAADPTNPMMSAARRRERVVEVSGLVEGFYNPTGQ